MLQGRLCIASTCMLAHLVAFGCSPSKSSGDAVEKLAIVEGKLTAEQTKLTETQAKLTETQARLTAAEALLAEYGEKPPAPGEQPKPHTSPDKWKRCRALTHDTTSPRTPLADLAKRHPGVLMGIDLSHYDGRPDFGQVAAANVAFVYIKATQGTGFHDPCFQRNAEGAGAANLLWGAYHILDPKSDPVAQADVFLKAVGDRKYTLPLVLDIEDHLVNAYPVDDITDKISRWLAHVEQQSGHKPMLYVGHNLMKSYFKKQWSFGDHKVWFADYNNKANPDYMASMPAWTLWQFVDNGQVPSIRSAVDTNLFRGTREQLTALLREQKP